MPSKIAVFNYSSSGLFHYAACLVNSLADIPGTKILLLTSSFNNLELVSKKPNITVFAQKAPHRLPGFFRWLASPAQQAAIYRAVKQFNPDVIHLTDSHALYVPHGWWLKRYPIVFTQHDPVTRAGDVYRLPSRLIHRTQQCLASRIVAHGDFIKNVLVKDRGLPPDKIATIFHGDYSFYLRWRDQNIVPQNNCVLFFGRIMDYKGLDVLLRSLINLQNSRPVHLLLAGPGRLDQYQPLLEQVKRKTINNYFIPDEEVAGYFQRATLVALPYREASQSGVVSIALPAGTPVVATRTGSLPEILKDGENSLLVPPGDVQALTEAVGRLLDDKELRRRLAAGGKRTAADIAWPKTARKYFQLYQSVI